MQRRTALTTVERKGFGGSSFDSLTHAAMFRTYKPFNFGVKSAELFSSRIGEHLINKKFTYMTVAQKNVYTLPAGVDDYEWQLKGDADIDFRVTELLVADTAQPGKGGLSFKIAIDRDWLTEPAIIKSESSNAPLLTILGYPKQRSANSWEYEVELQTGDMNAWLPVEYLQPGKRFIRVSTAVSDELNDKYAGDSYSEMFKLQSWVGNFANKAEFTDKFIRMEISAREQGRTMPKGMSYSVGGQSFSDGAVGMGFMYQQKFNTTNSGESKVIEKGVFISQIEARLLERTEMDAEMNMEFGNIQKTKDRDSGRTKKIAPGWRQILERIF